MNKNDKKELTVVVVWSIVIVFVFGIVASAIIVAEMERQNQIKELEQFRNGELVNFGR
jgi:hypothetical protein